MYEIAVNLATFNRAPFLEKCLESLCSQTIDPSRYEICVVNNACTDDTPAVVERIAARYPQHRVFMVREPRPGLSRARNCGIAATTAPLIANVDDDGTVVSDWLERFLRAFAEHGENLAIVGGDIEPVWGAPPPEWMTKKMRTFLSAETGLGKEARLLNDEECTSEGNSCYRRAALLAAGCFPENLGRVGNNLLSGENILEANIRKNGGKTFYDPGIVLRHYIHPERLRPLWFRQRFFWQGVTGKALRDYNLRHGLPVETEKRVLLPLDRDDWAFVAQDTAENLDDSIDKFMWLGWILSITDIIPTDA